MSHCVHCVSVLCVRVVCCIHDSVHRNRHPQLRPLTPRTALCPAAIHTHSALPLIVSTVHCTALSTAATRCVFPVRHPHTRTVLCCVLCTAHIHFQSCCTVSLLTDTH